MAATITKEEYDFFKSQNPKDLTQEELNWINEYEKAEAGAPSDEAMEWATFILNESNPKMQEINRKTGDFDKAMALLAQDRAAKQVMQDKKQDPYVKKVAATPDDIQSKFNFNWKSAYENVKNEKLKRTEADAKKLQGFIDSNMYGVDDDDVKLQQIAYNLHMYNPNTMKWTDFINSDQGEEFKKYLADIQNQQKEKELEDIWSGKDDAVRNWLVNFALPVSKEYAKKHYNDKDFSIKGPLVADAAANLAMMGPGLVSKIANRPLLSAIYGNALAPAITETGNVILNDESVPEALTRTAAGTAINIGTPKALTGGLSWAGRGLPTKEGKRALQKTIDEAANAAAKVQNDIRKGKPYPIRFEHQPGRNVFAQKSKDGSMKYYSADVAASKKDWPNRHFESVENMPPEAVTEDEIRLLRQGAPFLRGKDGKTKAANSWRSLQDEGAELMKDDLLVKKAVALAKDGDLRSLTPSELRQLGFADKESFMNYLIRQAKTSLANVRPLQSYLTNAAGRPEFGKRLGSVGLVNLIFGTDFFGKEQDTPEGRIERVFGKIKKK